MPQSEAWAAARDWNISDFCGCLPDTIAEGARN